MVNCEEFVADLSPGLLSGRFGRRNLSLGFGVGVKSGARIPVLFGWEGSVTALSCIWHNVVEFVSGDDGGE